MSEKDALDSFTRMQLDVLCGLWQLHHDATRRPRPPTPSPRIERNAEDRDHSLRKIPVGTVGWRNFADVEGRLRRYRHVVYNYKKMYYQVPHSDGDWEKLKKTDVE